MKYLGYLLIGLGCLVCLVVYSPLIVYFFLRDTSDQGANIFP